MMFKRMEDQIICCSKGWSMKLRCTEKGAVAPSKLSPPSSPHKYRSRSSRTATEQDVKPHSPSLETTIGDPLTLPWPARSRPTKSLLLQAPPGSTRRPRKGPASLHTASSQVWESDLACFPGLGELREIKTIWHAAQVWESFRLWGYKHENKYPV